MLQENLNPAPFKKINPLSIAIHQLLVILRMGGEWGIRCLKLSVRIVKGGEWRIHSLETSMGTTQDGNGKFVLPNMQILHNFTNKVTFSPLEKGFIP